MNIIDGRICLGIFSRVIFSASKERFINKIWDDSLNDNVRKELIKWVDSGAADSYLKKIGWNWQKSNDINELIKGMNEYNQAGGSRKDKKENKKQNPYQVFRDSGLKVVNEGEDCSDMDMVLLTSLENENFIFVTPLTWEACKFMDSFECGGQGAKWCIGYEQDEGYWREYTKNENLFILAYSKKENPPKNELKYMIQLNRNENETEAWRQDDDSDTIIKIGRFPRAFGHDANEFIDVMVSQVLCDDNVYNAYNEGWGSIDSQIFEFDRSEMEDWTLYYNDFNDYDNEAIAYKSQFSRLTIDFEYGKVDPSKVNAKSSSGSFNIPIFIDNLRKRGLGNVDYICLLNGEFDKVIYCPEATNFKCDVIFKGCIIKDIYFEDYSNGETKLILDDTNVNTVTLSEDSRYDTLTLNNHSVVEFYEEEQSEDYEE